MSFELLLMDTVLSRSMDLLDLWDLPWSVSFMEISRASYLFKRWGIGFMRICHSLFHSQRLVTTIFIWLSILLFLLERNIASLHLLLVEYNFGTLHHLHLLEEQAGIILDGVALRRLRFPTVRF